MRPILSSGAQTRAYAQRRCAYVQRRRFGTCAPPLTEIKGWKVAEIKYELKRRGLPGSDYNKLRKADMFNMLREKWEMPLVYPKGLIVNLTARPTLTHNHTLREPIASNKRSFGFWI